MAQTAYSDASKEGSKTKQILKTTSLAVAGAVLFLSGLGIGNGSISLGAPSSNSENKNLAENLNYDSVERVYDLLRAKYDGKLDAGKLQDGLKAGLAAATGDPYTQYFSSSEAKKFDEQLTGSFTGIGAELGQDEDKNLIIVSPIDGFPASKAGLRPQDIIVAINGQSTADMSVDQAVNKIRGPKATTVTLRILRNKSEDLTLTITRDDIKVPSVKWEAVDGNVGVITISQFGDDTTDLMTRAASELKDKGVTKLVLDLRGDPGGLLTAAVDVSKLWVPADKTILQEKRSGVVTDTYTSDISGDPVFKGMPTVVLVNAGSASASEIVAGALRDNNVATVYGEKSYGKGSVQEIHNLPGGAEIKITVARWYRPNGQNIDKKGIKPDKEIKMTDDDYKQKKDPQKDAALEHLRAN